MKNRLILLIILLVLPGMSLFSQEKQKFLTLNGYLSDLQTAMFDSLSGPLLIQNLIHNRLNFKGYINTHVTFAAEFRNRLFTGDLVRAGITTAEATGEDPGLIDMSWNILDEQSFFLNTTTDRLWIDFNYGKIQARIGRQRINWGQTLVWNPNDLFNTYSFFDFDYVERPGSDAVRLQYYPGYSSVAELVVKGDYMNRLTAAGLYRFNRWGYDIQFLGGYFEGSDIVAGTGWSGSLGPVSFRGEATWFQPAGGYTDNTGTGIFTIGFDRIFKNNSLAQVQLMYCNNPLETSDFGSLYFGTLSAKDLAYSKFTCFGLFTWQVTPLLSLSASAMWFPDLKGYYAGPSLDCSLAENIDFTVYWQHFETAKDGIESRINLGFLRIKYSF